jgi:N-acetylglutamate synthase-like GNAT family acetyltransferase/GNAT superfamily N-acetyltransferase
MRSHLVSTVTVSEVQKIPEVAVRSFRPGDEETFFELLNHSFGTLEYLPRLKAEIIGPYLNREGCFIAEMKGSAIGCVGLRNHPRQKWHEIRYLAVKNSELRVSVAQNLVARAALYAESIHAEHLTAFVPAIQPYVDVYKSVGFEPVRRSIRIDWELTERPTGNGNVQTQELLKEHANDAAEVWVEGLRPYWNYWIEEQGGPEELKSWVKGSVGTEAGWIGAFFDEQLVGLAILRPDSYGSGEARFNGAYVLPKFREKRIGSALMNATICEAQRLHQKRMKVYTLAFLDHLAPGSLLYLKSGGKIEAEYLQLQK